jgi:arginase
MSRVELIVAPYDLGRENVGLGLGPGRWLSAGLEEALWAAGAEVKRREVRRSGPFREELSAVEDVNDGVAEAVGAAAGEGAFPLVIAGSCINSLGILGGLGTDALGVVWFDAHGDFNTPATSPGGFLDGMVLAIATGASHPDTWRRAAGGPAIPQSRVVLLGTRDLDPPERERLEGSEVEVVGAESIRAAGGAAAARPALEKLRSRAEAVYLHLDMDALDPAVAPCNRFQTEGGLSLKQAAELVEMVGELFAIKAAAITAYDPEFDEEGRAAEAGVETAVRIVEAATRS